jgi:5-methylcytosine-specific restriction endonuclease McrA
VAPRAYDDGPRPTRLDCDGPLDVDHVRASGGLGMKSPTHRTNMVVLCRHHHRAKTEYGKTWRPLLLAYLERVEGRAA